MSISPTPSTGPSVAECVQPSALIPFSENRIRKKPNGVSDGRLSSCERPVSESYVIGSSVSLSCASVRHASPHSVTCEQKAHRTVTMIFSSALQSTYPPHCLRLFYFNSTSVAHTLPQLWRCRSFECSDNHEHSG